MSLSAATGGGASGISAGASAWTSSVSANSASGFSGGGSSSCADGCCAPSARPHIATVLNQGNVRGELSGDNCFCVELGEDKVCGAVWSETDFAATNLRTATSGAVGITPAGNQLLVDGVDREDDLTGILFGADVERAAQKNPNVDIVYPTQLLCSKETVEDDFHLPGIDEDMIELTHSSEDAKEKVSIYPEQALSLLLLHWYHKTKAVKSSGEKVSKKKKKNKKGNLVTLVVPGYFGVTEKMNAAKGVRAASMDIRNIFSRGLASVAAALSHPSQSTSFYSSLQSWMTKRDCGCVSGSADPIVLFVHTGASGFEVSLVRCERPRVVQHSHCHDDDHHHSDDGHSHSHGHKGSDGGPATNLMGFDRLVVLAAGGGPFLGMGLGSPSGAGDAEKQQCLRSFIVRNMRVANITDTSEIAAVILSGSGGAKDLQKCFSSGSSHATDSDDDYTFVDHPDDRDNGGEPKTSAASSPKLQVDWAYLSSCPVQVSADGEASRGGALLSAAEMESCKQYVENEDGEASLAYALSIGEDVIPADIGFIIFESSKDQPKSATTVFRAGTAVHKKYVGPPVTHRSTDNDSLLASPLTFDSGKVSLIGSHRPAYERGYPKLLMVEKKQMQINGKRVWHATSPPISVLNRRGRSDDLALKCSVKFCLNETTGTAVAENSQDESVQSVVDFRSQVFRVMMTFVLVLVLVAGWYFYGEYSRQLERQLNEAWLTDFYEKNAPEKLSKDSELIEKTLRKYGKDMFVLWRKLEKTYNVRWKPPSTIVDSDGGL